MYETPFTLRVSFTSLTSLPADTVKPPSSFLVTLMAWLGEVSSASTPATLPVTSKTPLSSFSSLRESFTSSLLASSLSWVLRSLSPESVSSESCTCSPRNSLSMRASLASTAEVTALWSWALPAAPVVAAEAVAAVP